MNKIQEFLYGVATGRVKGLFPFTLGLFLYPISLLYAVIVFLLSRWEIFFVKNIGSKVISVGNITLGGTGKTSLAEYIAVQLRLRGHKIAILTRGYKKESFGKNSCKQMGDEPYMLAKKLKDVPVLVNRDRIKSGYKAVKDYGVDTVILDDGMQQWGIKKDLEIITVDASNPFGNKMLIPRGILREPLFALKRADIFVLTKIDFAKELNSTKGFLNKINPRAVIIESSHRPVGFVDINRPQELLPLDLVKDKSVTVFSGIADPGSFEELTRSLVRNISLCFRFDDHHLYTKDEIEDISLNSKKRNIDVAITTDKDAVKLEGIESGIRVLILRIEMSFKDEKRFSDRLFGVYNI